jgi:hypothetical protein
LSTSITFFASSPSAGVRGPVLHLPPGLLADPLDVQREVVAHISSLRLFRLDRAVGQGNQVPATREVKPPGDTRAADSRNVQTGQRGGSSGPFEQPGMGNLPAAD